MFGTQEAVTSATREDFMAGSFSLNTGKGPSDNLRKFTRAIRLLGAQRPDMYLSLVLFLMEIADGEEHTVRDLTQQLGMPNSTAYRIATVLGEEQRPGSPKGLGAISLSIDPIDRRQRIVKLTAKGKRLIRDLEEILA